MEDVDEESYDEDYEGSEIGDDTSGYCSPDKRKHAITGRGVTLAMLMSDGVIEPGKELLSIEYLGRKFTADLLPSGKILSPVHNKTFNSPSAWAIHCKKLINPEKKSGCRWASVKYKGRKLVTWKSTWFRKQSTISSAMHSQSPLGMSTENGLNGELEGRAVTPKSDRVMTPRTDRVMTPKSDRITTPKSDAVMTPRSEQVITPKSDRVMTPKSEDGRSDVGLTSSMGPLDLAPRPAHTSTPYMNGSSMLKKKSHIEKAFHVQEEALNLSLRDAPASAFCETEHSMKEKPSVKHSSLPQRSQNLDPNLLVECETFSSLGKTQPFTVSLTTNSMLLMDFHCHLTTSEVVGYLGGKWDHTTQHLSILQAYPCRCRLGDTQHATQTEEEIRQTMSRAGLSLVGWYHSHPYSQPDPSVKDVDCQMSYQLRMKGSGSTYFPCVGVIISPYYKKAHHKDSLFRMFMVMPPLEDQPSEYGIPMNVKFSKRHNPSLTEDLLSEMKHITDFFRGAPDWVRFRHSWQPSISYMEKIKSSLSSKLPEDQMENGTFLDFVQHLLIPK